MPTTATNNFKNVVNEWKISTTDANVVDPASRREVISFGKNAANHNGGTITFGPDGYLYLGLGDGGNANDVGSSHIEPGGNAQNLSTPLGKFLRFDPLNPALTPTSPDPVSANGQYRIPTSNPFQGPGQVPEIYAYGMRNPYRFSFDRANGDLIHADVGQNNIEEIDRIVIGGNYGWPIKEGDFLFNRTNGPSGNAGTIGAPPGNRSPGSPAGLIDPITGTLGTLEYDHNEGISITGGFVYRGTAIPELYGKYVFGDLALKTAPVRADGRIFYADLQTGLIKAFPLFQFGGSAILPNGLTVHGFVTAGIAGAGNLEDHGLFGSIAALVPTITTIADKGLAATINWAGGVGPFLLQKKLSLSDAAWWNVLTTSNRSVTVAKEDPMGFFRVVNQAQATVSPFTVLLNGASEIPVGATPATGLGTLSVEGNLFTYHISFSGLSAAASAAHVHGPASATNSAGVLFPLNGASGTAGVLSGTHTLTSAELQAITNGLAYVNIHTALHPGGEIRGQIVPLQLTATLNGASEVPPVATAATGTGLLTLIGNDLLYGVSYSGLAGTATGAHIHGPTDPTQPAPILVPLNTPTGTSGSISGAVSLTPAQLAHVLAGMAYINIHSTPHPGGEIRGQIRR